MEIIIALCLGIALSAACGFRVFMPPLAMSMAANYGDFNLSPELAWLGSYPAMIVLIVAVVVEVLAYYIPVVDNLLDLIEIPTAIAVGTVLTAANLGDINPVLQWSLAAIAGGGTAGIIESATSMTRLASTSMTGGIGNIFLATMEALSAAVLSILALTLPLLAAGLVIGLLIFAIAKLIKLSPSLFRKLKRLIFGHPSN
ncbi:MAG: DUF4126 domain-containing protein [Cyanobacteria bacterium P01_F01_bin.143]